MENKPCPFCGGEVDPKGWMTSDGSQGPECEGCGATAESLEQWNTRLEDKQLADMRISKEMWEIAAKNMALDVMEGRRLVENGSFHSQADAVASFAFLSRTSPSAKTGDGNG